jgi:DeoR/GlpR family transcriptional regulator of sugar metabolism
MGRPAPRSDVFASERRLRIARVIEENGRARAVDLAVRFGVSAFTIRKDLHALEASGQVTRAYGGAIATNGRGAEGAFQLRQRLRRGAKDAIGRVAAALVVDGESIAMDASTTALAVAHHLKERGGWVHLTVITNGLRIASELASSPGITVAMPGGFVRWEALSLVGQLGDAVFRRVNVQKAFLGAAGFTLDSGLSDATEEEAQIKGFMASSAREVIGIVDSSKWSRTAFATFCRTDALTAMVTDSDAPAEMIDRLRSGGVQVHLVPADEDRLPAMAAIRPAFPAAGPQQR